MNINQGSRLYLFNKYSWILFLTYISVIFTMQYQATSGSWESIYMTSPLIVSFIFWSEKINFLIQKSSITLEKSDSFRVDFFLISFSFLLGELLSFLFQFNNTDLRGWWGLALSFVTAYGILFSLIYSLFARLIDNHRKYTYIFSLMLIFWILVDSLLTYGMPLSFFALDEAFYGFTGVLIIIHILICFIHVSFFTRK